MSLGPAARCRCVPVNSDVVSHQAQLATRMPDQLRTSLNRRRHVYLLAMALPGISLGLWLRSPYHLYQLDAWAWAWLALVPICLVQFFRPTVVGWSLVVVEYTWAVFLQIQQHIGAFEDFGSEDHSRWDGWNVELPLLGVTACLVMVLIALVAYRPRKLVQAT